MQISDVFAKLLGSGFAGRGVDLLLCQRNTAWNCDVI